MGLILNIETATKVCSIALGKEGNLIDFIDLLEDDYSHSEKLNLSVVDLLKKNEILPTELDAIAISSGPGSYTGLRIGTSSAKGFCYGLDIPLIAINTLASLCQRVKITEGVKIPLIDARRMEVFGGLYSATNSKLKEDFNLVIESGSFSEIDEKKYLFGNGSEKLKELLSTNDSIEFIDNITCSAKGMVSLSEKKFKAKEFEDVAYFEPNYGKEFYTVPSKK